MKSVVILAHDPGSVNYGYAVIRATLPKSGDPRVTVLEHGKFSCTYRRLARGTPIRKETSEYAAEVLDICARHPVQIQIAERFMMRTAGGALTIELVNQMLGTLRGVCNAHGTPLKMIPSSEWKVPLRRLGVDLPATYKSVRPITPHQLDACLIATYGVFVLTGRKPYTFLDVHKWIRNLTSSLPASARSPR